MFFKKALQRGARYKPNGLIQGSWKYEYDWPKPRACFSGQPKCLLSFSSSWVMICIEGAEKNLKFIYSFCYLDYISYFVFVLLFFFLTFGAAVCHNSSFKLITAWTTVITSAKCWFGRRNVLLSLGEAPRALQASTSAECHLPCLPTISTCSSFSLSDNHPLGYLGSGAEKVSLLLYQKPPFF